MLYFAHGVLSRRLRVRPDQDADKIANYSLGDPYARGTASGGGLYPSEIYWSCGAGAPMTAGIYHYDNAHHALERLSTGDLTATIRAATFNHPAAQSTNQFLLISANFWKNAYKYNNFCYHVVTQDIGALLCSLWFLALGYGASWCPILWYQDEPLNDLLGLDVDDESVFTVLPLPTSFGPVDTSSLPADVLHIPSTNDAIASTYGQVLGSEVSSLSVDTSSLYSFQRSKRTSTFPLNVQTHRSTLVWDEPRPNTQHIPCIDDLPGTGEKVTLPEVQSQRLRGDLLEIFQRRRSSFGTLVSPPVLSREDLATLLALGSSTRHYTCDVRSGDDKHFTRLMVFVNNVTGIARGAYAYDAHHHCLQTVQQGDMTLFLQQNYLLPNYSLADTGALIAIVGDVDSMLTTYGNRGYRLLNAEAGLVVQGLYMIATSLQLACGAALGFNKIALNTALGLDGTSQKTLLFMLIGHEPPVAGDIAYALL